MFEGYMYYALTIALLSLVGAVMLFPRFPIKKQVTLVAYLILLGTIFQSTVDLLSRPRPVEIMLKYHRPNPEVADMLSVFMKEDDYIMMLLNWEGLEYPRYFRFPWSDEMAEQIRGAIQGGREKGTGVEMFYPFDDSLDRREHPWARNPPVPKQGPRKQENEPEIFEYNHPSRGA